MGRKSRNIDPMEVRAYQNQGLNYQEIADKFGCSRMTIMRRVQAHEREKGAGRGRRCKGGRPPSNHSVRDEGGNLPPLPPGLIPDDAILSYELPDELTNLLLEHFETACNYKRVAEKTLSDIEILLAAVKQGIEETLRNSGCKTWTEVIDDEDADNEEGMGARGKLNAFLTDSQRQASIITALVKNMAMCQTIASNAIGMQREATGLDTMQAMDAAMRRVQNAGFVVGLPPNMPTPITVESKAG